MQWWTDAQCFLSIGSSYPTPAYRAVFCCPPALRPWVSHLSLDLLLSFEGHMLNMCLVLFMPWGQKGHWTGSKYGSREAAIFWSMVRVQGRLRGMKEEATENRVESPRTAWAKGCRCDCEKHSVNRNMRNTVKLKFFSHWLKLSF